MQRAVQSAAPAVGILYASRPLDVLAGFFVERNQPLIFLARILLQLGKGVCRGHALQTFWSRESAQIFQVANWGGRAGNARHVVLRRSGRDLWRLRAQQRG